MDSGSVFLNGLEFFGHVVDRVDAEAWDRPSPCDGWTALDVMGHLTTSLGMGLALFAGEQPTWPRADRPADLIEGDPAAMYRELSQRCRTAFEGADLDQEMDTPMGRRTVGDRLAFPAVDLYVHAWDIGRAAGLDVEIPQDVIEFTHSFIDPLPVEAVRGSEERSGAFGPEVEAPADATPSEAFIAWTGRSPR
ncbi:MAG: TIGR03086 family metal-binding protein [Microthrixaceae bacterium]